jgi:hypothetical protein
MTGNIMNFSLFSGSDDDVLSRVLCGQPDMTQAKPDTKNSEKVQPQDSDKRNIIQETHTQRKDITLSTSAAPNPTLVPTNVPLCRINNGCIMLKDLCPPKSTRSEGAISI